MNAAVVFGCCAHMKHENTIDCLCGGMMKPSQQRQKLYVKLGGIIVNEWKSGHDVLSTVYITELVFLLPRFLTKLQKT